ncbi:MAG: amidohydrolase family protein [Ilumatobacteraceae bacterium]
MSSWTARVPQRRADVAIAGDRVVAVEESITGPAGRVVGATDRIVTPGFVDIHTHLDAQLLWDPVATSSCWHGVTSVVLGNCGVTFAPCRPEDRESLAELMESVEDIPCDAILQGLPWEWVTYGDYLRTIGGIAKGPNVGGLVGHVAVRQYVMGERALGEEPATAGEIAAMAELVHEAMASGALGFSTSRTLLHRVPDGRPVPGTWARPEELYALGDVLGAFGKGVFENAGRFGERDDDHLSSTRAELAWMGELTRRCGRPMSFGLAQSNRRPEVYELVLELARGENARGANLRPQTTARGVGVLYHIEGRTPFDGAPAWLRLKQIRNGGKLVAMRDNALRTQLIAEAEDHPSAVPLTEIFVLPVNGPARYDCDPADSLAAHAERRGVSAAAAYIELLLESDGRLVCNHPFLNQDLGAVQTMLDDPLVTLGLADAGAHVAQIMDASQPTFLLDYWVKERGRWTLEEAVRRLTSDPASLFGIRDRGVLRSGSFADLNVIDLDALSLPQPEFVWDLPQGAGRFVQRAEGYDCTVVNGQVFMEHGVHTGALPGQLLTP